MLWRRPPAWAGIAHYLLLDRVHRGYCNDVWRAVSLKDHRMYALKILIKSKLRSKTAVNFRKDPEDIEFINEWDRSTKEIRILERLKDCEHIVNLVEVLKFEEAWVVVLEYLPEPLARYDAEGRYHQHSVHSEKEFWAVAADLVSIVEEISKHNVCHKDIKPENILRTFATTRQTLKSDSDENAPNAATTLLDRFTETNQKDLVDLTVLNTVQFPLDVPAPPPSGAAVEVAQPRPGAVLLKCVDFNISSEHSLVIFDGEGTNAFTPPECFQHDQKGQGIDGAKRDLWSVGVCLYTLLFQRLPYWHNIPIQLQFMIIADDEASIDFSLERIPWSQPDDDRQSAVQFVQRILLKDPASRLSLREARDIVDAHSKQGGFI